jgi:hydrogenase expression/formation protein HypC
MCLGVPGRIIEITSGDPLTRMGKVSFGGAIADVCLATVPEANMGDYVIVHAGFAISTLDEQEADQVFEYLSEIAAVERALPADTSLPLCDS